MKNRAALEQAGVRIREVQGLEEGAVWLGSLSMLLVSHDLSCEDRAAAYAGAVGQLALAIAESRPLPG